MQKQAARKRTFEELPKPDIYRSYRQTAPILVAPLLSSLRTMQKQKRPQF